MERENLEIIILICCILIVIGITAKINFNSESKTCDNCRIVFKNTQVLGREVDNQEFSTINVSAKTLYNGYLNEVCPIFWDNNMGWRLINN